MTTLTETRHAGEFILAEMNGNYSRENITVLSGEDLAAGTVVGRTLTGGAGVATGYAINAGSVGAMGAITVTGRAKVGTYRLTILDPATDAGKFEVVDPDGIAIGTGNVASAFSAGGLAFTLADGATNFSAGEGFTIAVTGTEKYAEWDPDATDGTEIAAAVLYAAVDASAADAAGVIIARSATVNGNCLGWITGSDAGEIAAATAQLLARGIVVRN